MSEEAQPAVATASVWVKLESKDSSEEEDAFPIALETILGEKLISDLKVQVVERAKLTCADYKLKVYPPRSSASRANSSYEPGKKLTEVIDRLQHTSPPSSFHHPLIVKVPAQASVQDDPRLAYMFARMKKAENDEKTLQLSRPSGPGFERAMNKIGIRPDAPQWEKDEKAKREIRQLGRNMANFRWAEGKEDSSKNKELYMTYLTNTRNISRPDGSKLFDGTKVGDLLSAEMLGGEVKTKGNIDVVIAAAHHQNVRTTSRNMWAGIALKRQDNKKDDEIRRQVILQHLSAAFLNESRGILTIMTDLGPRWHFYWFSEEQKALMEYEATSRGAANYLIRHMMDTGDTSAPTDFLNRASWNQMFPPLSGSDDETEGGDGKDNDGKEDDNGEEDDDDREEDDNRPKKKRALPNLDFMDEEEEREARFRDVLQRILPQLRVFPPQMPRNDRHGEGPPMHIGGS